MSLWSVLVNVVVRILSVNLEDLMSLCDSPLGLQLSTDLRVIPLITRVYDLAIVNLCQVVPSLWVSNS